MERKYTLPRHTNLATQSSRIGAFFLDFAFLFVAFMVLFYGCAVQIFWFSSGYNLKTQMQTYTLQSHLLHLNERNEVTIYNEDTHEIYEKVVSYYYLSYLTGNVPDGEVPAPNYDKEQEFEKGYTDLAKNYYTISWFNNNVLGITDADPSRETSTMYFTYQRDAAGNYDLTKIGVPRTERYSSDKGQVVKLTENDITQQYKTIYQIAYRHLETQSFYLDSANPYYMGFSIAASSSLLVAGALIYLLFPVIFKNGQTLGKKILKLGLANNEGYKFHNRQLLMRFMPYGVCSLAIMLPFWNNMMVIFIILLIILLVSFALMMASPKRASLHDFCARTIVIDRKTSIIFNDFVEEAEYLEKEDNLPKEVYSGEEPELRYEK